MSGNKGGERVPFFRKREELSAGKLNAIVELIIRKIIGTPPIIVETVPGGVSIGIDLEDRRARPQVVPAKVAVVNSDGSYHIDTYEGGYALAARRTNIKALAVDDSITFTVGQKVAVFATRLEYWIISASSAGSTIYKITSNVGLGHYKMIKKSYPGEPAHSSDVEVDGYEDNGSVSVPVNQYVEATMRGDGNLYFNMPFGC